MCSIKGSQTIKKMMTPKFFQYYLSSILYLTPIFIALTYSCFISNNPSHIFRSTKNVLRFMRYQDLRGRLRLRYICLSVASSVDGNE